LDLLNSPFTRTDLLIYNLKESFEMTKPEQLWTWGRKTVGTVWTYQANARKSTATKNRRTGTRGYTKEGKTQRKI